MKDFLFWWGVAIAVLVYVGISALIISKIENDWWTLYAIMVSLSPVLGIAFAGMMGDFDE